MRIEWHYIASGKPTQTPSSRASKRAYTVHVARPGARRAERLEERLQRRPTDNIETSDPKFDALYELVAALSHLPAQPDIRVLAGEIQHLALLDLVLPDRAAIRGFRARDYLALRGSSPAARWREFV
jgi:hypothetical protein